MEPPTTPTAVYRAPQTSGLAITSLVCGILSLMCLGPVLGIPAVICGHIALSSINRDPGSLEGKGMAIAGLVTGYIGTLLTGIMVVGMLAGMLLPALSQAREKARRINCAGNLKQVGLACRMYSSDASEHFPDDGFRDLAEQDYLGVMTVYCCPSTADVPGTEPADLDADGHCSYLYFGRKLTEDCGMNPSYQTVLASDRPTNHRRFMNILFADGHVQGIIVPDPNMTIEEIAAANGFFLPTDDGIVAPGPTAPMEQ